MRIDLDSIDVLIDVLKNTKRFQYESKLVNKQQ